MENKIKKIKFKYSDNKILVQDVKVADQFLNRLKGLMFEEKLMDCDGLLITSCNSIHTFFMLMPIDVLFLNNEDKVIKIIRNLRPWRMTGIYFKATKVLEMKVGTIPQDLVVGERLIKYV